MDLLLTSRQENPVTDEGGWKDETWCRVYTVVIIYIVNMYLFMYDFLYTGKKLC